MDSDTVPYQTPADYARTLTTAIARPAARDDSSARRAIAHPAPNGVNNQKDSGRGWRKVQGQVRYGKGLTAAFFLAVAIWGAVLIILPQLTMLERALTAPKRALDSSMALRLSQDAGICIATLERYTVPTAPTPSDGLAVPSPSGMAIPSPSTTVPASNGGLAIPSPSTTSPTPPAPSVSHMAIPSMNGAAQDGAATRPYILQCDRATTHVALNRSADEEPAWLDTSYDLPLLTVLDTDPVEQQTATATEIQSRSKALYSELRAAEATRTAFTSANFAWLAAARQIPMNDAQKAISSAQIDKRMLTLVGLRFERDGQIYERIGLITLVRTIFYAVAATALALVVCYPIAYKVALTTPPARAVWLFTGLIIPYAIVELMRVYAWTSIIDNHGVINSVLMWAHIIDDPIQLKRSPLTVFVVAVYTYVLFMVFPIFNVMATLDKNQIEAARDLGASPLKVHSRIVIPHSKPGIAVGTIATFMLAAGAFSVPRIISRGLQSEWFAQTIYNKFFESENSNVGAAYSFAYTLICFALVALFMWIMRTRLKDFARLS